MNGATQQGASKMTIETMKKELTEILPAFVELSERANILQKRTRIAHVAPNIIAAAKHALSLRDMMDRQDVMLRQSILNIKNHTARGEREIKRDIK